MTVKLTVLDRYEKLFCMIYKNKFKCSSASNTVLRCGPSDNCQQNRVDAKVA